MRNLKVYFYHSTKRINTKFEAPIYGRIQIRGERADFATGIFVRPAQWKNGLVKQHLSADHFNLHLSELDATIRSSYSQMRGSVTAKELKAITIDNLPFMAIVERFIDRQKECAPNTLRTYNARQALLKRYQENLSIENINQDWARNYYTWLIKNKYNRNYAVRNVKFVSMVCEFSVSEKLIKNNPLFGMKFKGEGPKPIISLTSEELQSLENFNFSSIPLQKAADLFLFQVYTGFDFADLCTVDFVDVKDWKGQYYIFKKREKTGEEAIIPYCIKAENIWSKYNYKLPVMQNQPYNRFLKEVAAICGINKALTSHVGRKTFTMHK